jgi:hypothetical protein
MPVNPPFPWVSSGPGSSKNLVFGDVLDERIRSFMEGCGRFRLAGTQYCDGLAAIAALTDCWFERDSTEKGNL